jgi:alanyl-tRNA synthetase
LRFDFSHFERLRDDEITEIESMVNGKIFEAIDVNIEELPIEKARTVPNVKMFFGDKYGDRVRVVTIDPSFSVEFCGGTHVRNTSQIGMFKILSESSVASGVRRIEAIAGRSIPAYIGRLLAQADEARGERETMVDRVRQLEKQIAALKTDELRNVIPSIVEAAHVVDGVRVATGTVGVDDMEQLKQLGDELRAALKTGGIGLLAAVVDDKVQLVCVVTDDLTSSYKAGTLVGAAAKRVGGGGGGKPHLATAGGKDVASLDALLTEFPLMINN